MRYLLIILLLTGCDPMRMWVTPKMMADAQAICQPHGGLKHIEAPYEPVRSELPRMKGYCNNGVFFQWGHIK